MSTFLYRLGHLVVRRRWFALVAWIVLLVGVGACGVLFKGVLSNSFTIPGTAGQAALATLQQEIPSAGSTTGKIVYATPAGETLVNPVYQGAIRDTLTEIATLPSVTGVVDPQTGRTIAPALDMAYATIQFSGQLTEIPSTIQDEIARIAAAHEVDGLQIELAGGAVPQAPSIGSTEGIGVVVALVVLTVTFGSLVAAAMPMITALIGVAVGLAGILWVSGTVDMSSTAPILALMLGLAVGIDYALFIVSRHRTQVRDGMGVEESIARAVGTAGTAVVFAGLTVIIALAGLTVVGIPFLSVMGLAAAATVAVSVLIAITLLPALLGFAGLKVLRRKDRSTTRELHASGTGNTGVIDHAATPHRWVTFVTRYPAWVLIVGIIGMGVLAIPLTKLHLGLPDDGTASPDRTNRKAYDLISERFGPGFNGPLLVTVSAPPETMEQALGTLATDITAEFPGQVAYASPGGVSADGDFGFVSVIPTSGPSALQTQDLVNALRADAGNLGATVGGTVAVTGFTAIAIDVSAKLAAALPVYLILVVGLALVLLLLIFRSIVVPVKAAVGFLLSIGVSFGAVVAVYQWGWLSSIFGVDTPAPIISFLPILLIGVLFGLAMDYEVFMVSGMREAYVHGADPKRAVVGGFTAASRVVTAAAIIMTSVFAGFILAPDAIIASIGFALGVGVLADAFVVRMTLVPAVMALLGKAAWYLPRWLGRILPNVDIEGEQLLASLQPAGPAPAGSVSAGSVRADPAVSDDAQGGRHAGPGTAAPSGPAPGRHAVPGSARHAARE